MYCTSCGAQIAQAAAFCQSCGTRLGGISPAKETTKSAAESEAVTEPTVQDFDSAPLGAEPTKPYFHVPSSATASTVDTSSINNGFAWALAFAPLLLAIVDVSLSATMNSSTVSIIGFLLAFGANTALTLADSKQLAAKGIKISAFLGIFFIPAYLFSRSKALGRSYAPLLVWIATFILSLAMPSIAATTIGSQASTAASQTAITNWLHDKGYPYASVSCPATVISRPGAVFDCIATGTGLNSVDIQVTIQNTNGDIVWKVAN